MKQQRQVVAGFYQHHFCLPAGVLLQDAQRLLQGCFSLGDVGEVHTGELAGAAVSSRLRAGCRNKAEQCEKPPPPHQLSLTCGCVFRSANGAGAESFADPKSQLLPCNWSPTGREYGLMQKTLLSGLSLAFICGVCADCLERVLKLLSKSIPSNTVV